ncbi:MAG TPA: hypothetical protein VJ765_07240 [Chitinophagaceae bacterium]|nr:hypothetical protein [Chitinophagaceae bacterium]
MKFAFSNIDAGDLKKDRERTTKKPVSRSKEEEKRAGEIITDENKIPLFYRRRIKPPKYEYY